MIQQPELRAHQEWLGFVQPVGLVVSAPALISAQAFINKDVLPTHQLFLEHVKEVLIFGQTEPVTAITDLQKLLREVFGWQDGDLLTADDPRLEVVLPEYHETLRPTFVVPVATASGSEKRWSMLIEVLPLGTPFDKFKQEDERHWQATPQARFERLLRETQVPIGLLVNGTELRLVYAPRGESSGHVTFRIADMAQVAGRPIFAALHMLLCADRLFDGPIPEKQRLPAILAESRKYQNTVSNQLAEQVLAALYDLLRGFQAADDQAKGELLRDVLARDPDSVYAGLLTVLMRLVFLLYAEDRGLLSTDPVYVKHYSVSGLFERLRADAGRYPDTMDSRYGAWAQLLTLFRMIHDGAAHGDFHLPARHGHLFDPERFLFLASLPRQQGEERRQIPLVSDGVVFRVLNNLLMLDGERLSYRTLDVEQIGSVYETIMGYRMEKAAGRSIAIKPAKAHGAPVTINLEALLGVKTVDRGKWLKEHSDQSLTGEAINKLKAAATIDDLLGALDKKIAKYATPDVVPEGSMILQPSNERRRSGSHYTPRSLTEPIVRKTLEPILKRFGESPKPKAILDFKVCDPAMGSGAFLVETCRQLGAELVKAWRLSGTMPRIPPDEDELLHAQRIIAQRCLYGVDKNPMAVDLAKLSLWLATLAKDHPFTFLDHSLRCGDSLVGLSRAQIAEFNWKTTGQAPLLGQQIDERIRLATEYRKKIIEADDEGLYTDKRGNWLRAEESLNTVRFIGNVCVAAFFAEENDKKRRAKREQLLGELTEYLTTGNMKLRPTKAEQELRAGEKGITPFHWEIEFPEVFGRENGGFDAMVGNPPFLGGTLIGGHLGLNYHDYLVEVYSPATGLADVIAFFLRQSYSLLRHGGAFGLIATNTVAQGDTRSTGLEPIVSTGGSIYDAQRRYKWPGIAAVVVSVVHVVKSRKPAGGTLDGISVERISSFLLNGQADSMPEVLSANKGVCYLGTKIWGAGFVFEEYPADGSSSLSDLEQLLQKDSHNKEVIFPYLGAEEFNTSPTQSPSRFVIDFGNRSEIEARRWPELFSIVEERVRPVRIGNKQRNYRENWWLHANRVDEAGPFLREHGRMIAIACVSRQHSPAIVGRGTIIANSIVLLLLHRDADFAVIQSRIQEVWARFVGSSMKDDPRYTTPCFDTFPRPLQTDSDLKLETVGKEYYEYRAALMAANNEGLTKTYNRFHDPNETAAEIQKLRDLHAQMDRAVLDAYGWKDLQPTCEFLLDYEDEEEDEEDIGKSRKKKKPWRYRWPDEFRDEVLARLLELNKQRAEQQKLSGAAAEKGKKGGKGRGKKKTEEGKGLF